MVEYFSYERICRVGHKNQNFYIYHYFSHFRKSYLDSNHNLVEGKLHAYTPLIESPKLSVLAKKQVLLKLDNLQPSGSFKIRGIGNLVQHGKANGKKTAGIFQ